MSKQAYRVHREQLREFVVTKLKTTRKNADREPLQKQRRRIMVHRIQYLTRKIYLSDMRMLGRSGQAILYTRDGQSYAMLPSYAAKINKMTGCISSTEIVPYYKILEATVLIRKNGLEVAKRVKRDGQSMLLYTRRRR